MKLTLDRHGRQREAIRDVFEAALAAVDPEAAVHSALDGQQFDAATVLALGKASAAMARAAAAELDVGGLVISDHVEPVPDHFDLQLGGHPLPDEGSLVAARRAVELLNAGSGPVLFLISGGASALCELPVEGLDLADLAAVSGQLLRSGADIAELNTVRKHLSQVKGGRLAQRAVDRPALTLVLSDVVGSSLTVIGSGPTVPDPTTYRQAIGVLQRWGIEEPQAVLAELRAGTEGRRPETVKEPLAGHQAVIVADGGVAAEAALAAATARRIAARIETTEMIGETGDRARAVLEHAQSGMTFYAGETTVSVTGSGSGGRNQHAALAAAVALEAEPGTYFAVLATDGVDGPTSAAGAIVDGTTVTRGRARGLDARDHLERHDSHPYLAATGDLLRGGPTGTNVGDLWVVWRS